jgi:expansin (peptidoglycan-binding protein)
MKRSAFALALPAAFGMFVACVPADPGATIGDGAVTGSGGKSSATGGSSQSGTGGIGPATGGSSFSSGGQPGSGGMPATGGTPGTGGGAGPGTGGTAGRGAGGGTATGGGAGRGTGGGTATGGGAGRGTGGGTATGGGAGRGTGGSATGGSATGGSATGGSATGGSGPTTCSLPTHSGTGSYTHYYFGQGTFREGSGYRTACGYYGTEGGSSSSGPNDTVQNIPSMSPANAMYFAAIPGQGGFDSKGNCGACVQITGQNGKSVIATIADECPYGSDGGNTICGANAGGHLDLSTAAFDAIGPFTNSSGAQIGNPSNTTWKFVPCPVSGNLIVRIKTGNDNEIFIENGITAMKTVARGGENATRQAYGAWHFGTKLNQGDTLTLTDLAGRTITVQISSTSMNQNQDTGKQFPKCQ